MSSRRQTWTKADGHILRARHRHRLRHLLVHNNAEVKRDSEGQSSELSGLVVWYVSSLDLYALLRLSQEQSVKSVLGVLRRRSSKAVGSRLRSAPGSARSDSHGSTYKSSGDSPERSNGHGQLGRGTRPLLSSRALTPVENHDGRLGLLKHDRDSPEEVVLQGMAG